MKQQNILFISILSFVVVTFWIASNIYHTLETSTISHDLSFQISPIDGTFDMSTLQKLQQREIITPDYNLQTPLSQSQSLVASDSSQSQPAEDATNIPTQ